MEHLKYRELKEILQMWQKNMTQLVYGECSGGSNQLRIILVALTRSLQMLSPKLHSIWLIKRLSFLIISTVSP
jgi:hypothetical protein